MVVVAALFNVILSIVLAPLLHKIGPTLASRRRGRILLVVLCGFAVLCGLEPMLTGAAVLFLLMARQAVKEWYYQADWA
jgi:sorbitol-specific phosphotransferase system component IIBC